MERRKFIRASAAGLAGVAVSSQALAQSPSVKWRMASRFPKSLDALQLAVDHVAKKVSVATEGKFEIRTYAPGEIVPAAGVPAAVKAGTVECGYTTGFDYSGVEPTFLFDLGLPFGMNARQHVAWLYEGGGLEALRALYKTHNLTMLPCGNTGTQMGGWFRKEIKSVADIKGLKVRIPGLAGEVWRRMGATVVMTAPADAYPALEKGTIDAVEFIGPYDDERTGFNKIAKYYYAPSWWEPNAQAMLYINLAAWNSLPAPYQAVLEGACAEAQMLVMARYDARNGPALKRLIAGGTQLRQWPASVMAASYRAFDEVVEEMVAKNPEFAKIHKIWKPFRDEQVEWHTVAEGSFSDFMASALRASRRAQGKSAK